MDIYYYSSSVIITSNNENITAVFFSFPGVFLKLNYNITCHKNSHGLYISVSELFRESSDGHNSDCETKLYLELIDIIIMTFYECITMHFPGARTYQKY